MGWAFGFKYFLFIWLIFEVRCLEDHEQDLTITVEPGKEECYFQPVPSGYILDVEYQVIDGGHGDLDINFGLYSPTGRIIVAEFKKMDGSHRHQAKESGDYKVCFDNTFSRISNKVVFLELIVESEDNAADDDDEQEDITDGSKVGLDGIVAQEIYDIKFDQIQESIEKVKSTLSRIKHLQEQLRAFEARDRNIQEHNYARVNTWSFIQIVVMVVVGLIQIIMLRSLFDDKSRVHKVWNLKS